MSDNKELAGKLKVFCGDGWVEVEKYYPEKLTWFGRLRAFLFGAALGVCTLLAYNWIQQKIEERQSPLIERVTFPWER